MAPFHRTLRAFLLSLLCLQAAALSAGETEEEVLALEPLPLLAAEDYPSPDAPTQKTGRAEEATDSALTKPAVLPHITLPDVPRDNIPAQPKTGNQVVLGPLAGDTARASASEPPAQSIETPEKKDIFLNFENTDLANFIDYVAELKKLNILPDKTVEGAKISLTIREPLSITGVWNVFLSVLETAGFSLVKAGLVHKVVPKDKKTQQPLPAFINTPYDKLPENDLTIRYVFFLSNVPTADVQPLLESMLGQPSAVYENKEMNAFVITDKALNIRAAVKLLQELDQMGLPESVTILRLKRVNADDAKALLEALIRKPETNPLARLLGKTTEGSTEYFSPTTRVVAEQRSNSLILLGNKQSIDKVVEFISNHIDTDLKAAKSPLHIYELQNIDAAQVKEILTQVTAMPDSATGSVAGKYGSIRGGVKYFKNMSFNVDKDGNRLIANCPDQQDWELVKKTIMDLDKPQPQVAIESMIVSITENDTKFLGGVVRNKKHGQIGKNIDFQSAALTSKPTLEGTTDAPISLLGNMLGQLTQQAGSTVLSFGKNNIWGALQAVKQREGSSILEQPFITVANKTQGTITVGSTMRVVYEDQSSGGSSAQSFKDVDANTSIKITPQINLDGIIRMDIDVSIKNFTTPDGENTSTQSLTSKVTVADGQVVVLGGFIKTQVDDDKVETPILSKIPLVGWLFKHQNRAIAKQYIFIFLAPTIVKPRQSPGMNLYTKMKLHQATGDIEDAVETKRTLDPIHNWYFNAEQENYSHKVIDFANARYQPTTVDIRNDLFYRSSLEDESPARELQAQPHVAAPTATEAQPATALPTAEQPTALPPAMPAATTPSVRTENEQQQAASATPNQSLPAAVEQASETSQPLKALLANATALPAGLTLPSVQQPEPSKKPDNGTELLIDPRKRNSLKEFLAASPARVQRPPHPMAPRQGS